MAPLLLLGIASFYNGPGHSLHWFSLCAVVLAFWISRSFWAQNFANFRIAWGWLPSLALLYVGWLAIAPQVSTYPYVTWVQSAGLATLPLTMLGWWLAPDDDKDRAWSVVWRLLLSGGLILATWGIVDFILLRQRAHGPLIDTNAFGALINLFLLPSIFAYLITSGKQTGWHNPRLLLAVVALFALSLASTLSRGALTAFICASPLLIWASKGSAHFYKRLPALVIVLLAVFMVVKLAPSPIEPRASVEDLLLSPVEQAERDQAIQQRLLLWRSTWKMVGASNPVVGSGIGTFVTHYPEYRDPQDRTLGNHAHNDYLQALFEGGVIQLGFFVIITIAAPLWCLLLLVGATRKKVACEHHDITPGLLIGIFCVAVHAFVNFIHFVVPIALLTGLYLARAWEQIVPPKSYGVFSQLRWMPRPRLMRGSLAILLAIPVAVLIADGIIFKLFSTDGALIDRLDPRQRTTVLNAVIAVRPGNPTPRLALIRHLIEVAETSEPEIREKIVGWAEAETQKAKLSAPGTALVPFFQGKLRALSGDMATAQVYYETAVKRAPHSTMMRTELTRLYRQLGRDDAANRAVRDAKQWLHFERSMSALAEFAREAQVVVKAEQNSRESRYWLEIEAEAKRLAKISRSG